MKPKLHTQGGPYFVLLKEIIPFLETWKGPIGLSESDLSELAWNAIEPKRLMDNPQSPIPFAAKYVLSPDFVPRFITLVRAQWFKTNKRAQARRFVSQNSDGEIRNGEFVIVLNKEHADRAGIAEDDIEQARIDLSKRLKITLPESIRQKLRQT